MKTHSLNIQRTINPIMSSLAALAVLTLTVAFLFNPLLFLTIILYLFLAYFIVTNIQMGVVFTALSYPLVRNSFAAVSGNFLPALFYAVFIGGIVILFYANVLGYKIKLPSLMMDKYLLVLLLYIVFSTYFISGEKAYGVEKVKYFLMNIILFYLTILVIKKEADLEQVFKAIFYFCLFFTFFSILSFLDMEPYFGNELAGRFATLGMNPIWLSRYFSYGILIELYFIAKLVPEWDKHIGKIFILVVLIFVQLFFSMLTGSRGPIAAMMIAVLSLIILNFGKSIKLGTIFAIFAGMFVIFVLAVSLVPQDIVERLLSRDVGGQSSTMIRLVINLEALFMFWGNKLTGIGFGGFNIFYLKYPHNIITEVLAELGIIGIFLFSLILGLAVKYIMRIKRRIKKVNYYFLLVLLISSFINANLSGHLGSNFFFFFSLALLYSANQLTCKNDVTGTENPEI